MLRRSAKIALVGVLLLGASCESFSWTGRSGRVDSESAARGVKSVAELESEYESQRYWAHARQSWSGRWNAFTNGVGNIVDSFDRHFLNYSKTDPNLRY